MGAFLTGAALYLGYLVLVLILAPSSGRPRPMPGPRGKRFLDLLPGAK